MNADEKRIAGLAAQKRYRQSRPEYHRNRYQEWARKNRAHLNEYKRTHTDHAAVYARKRDAELARTRAWKHDHPESARETEARRRARKRGAGGSHSSTEWLARIVEFEGRCAYCKRSDLKLTRDHVIPVSRGGSDNIENIVPACGPCNSRKKDKVAA